MRNRLDDMFDRLQKRNEGAIIPLTAAGKMPFTKSMELIDLYDRVGIDAVEIIIPTRYPWMEGSNLLVHQLEAIRDGVLTGDSFSLMEMARKKYPQMPFLTLHFIGPVMGWGFRQYAESCKKAGMDGADVPDYPLVAGKDHEGFVQALHDNGVHFTNDLTMDLAMAEPGTPPHRLCVELVKQSSGFLFLIAQPGGQSGVKDKLPVEGLKPACDRLRKMEEDLGVFTPIIVVCGISTPEQVRDSIRAVGADGVMLGSAVSKRLQAGESLEKIEPFVRSLKDATRL
jgi:tryptophan synthase alpha chain